METRRAAHPTDEILKAFGLGKLDDSSSGALLAHLDLCVDCRKIVASQSGDDFLDRLRQAHSRNATPAPPKSLGGMEGKPKPPPGPTTLFNLPPELADNPQYDILRELGRGGMGVVYLAKNKLMDRLEVLKVINKALLDQPGMVERFLREIRSAAMLNHVNVVAAYSALQLGELLVFAMEYVEGQDLAAVVKAQGPLPVAHACFYVQQAAQGLQHAFEKKMVHRDIKPQNLILAREGRKHLVKVLDFGLAKVMREKTEETGLTGEGKMLGTPDYMAPEQTLDAASADIRADIYSLGCTLYFLLNGNRPFQGKNLYEIMQAHQSLEAPALNLARPEVPTELAAVVRKMMAKDRAQRYQTPLEVVQALKPFLKQATSSKSSPSLSAAGTKATLVPAVKTEGPSLPAGQVKPPPLPASPSAVAWDALMDSVFAATPSGQSGASTAAHSASRTGWLIAGGLATSLLLLGLLGYWLATVLLRVETPNGTLVVEMNDDEVEARIKNGKLILSGLDGKDRYTLTAKERNKKLEAGSYKIRVEGADGLMLDTPEFTIKKGGKVTVRVKMGLKAVAKEETPVAADAAWVKSVGAMSTAKQLVAVSARLKELNPGFDGNLKPKIEGGVITELRLTADKVKDISPVRALAGLRTLDCSGSTEFANALLADLLPLKDMNLTSLNCNFTQVSDLAPLKDMKLTSLSCWRTSVADLFPLKDMPLTFLDCRSTQVSDLSPLKGMKLTCLAFCETHVSDLSALKGMPLTELACKATQVSDLSPLKGMPLTFLHCGQNSRISDLSPLKDMKLTGLACYETKVSDLSPLKGMPLKEIWCDFKPERDAEILHSIKTLEKINGKSAADIWKEVEANQAKVVPKPAPSKELEALRRDQIAPEALKMAGGGDAKRAPASLVGVFGEAQPIHTGAVLSLAFSPDGRWLASASLDRTIMLRDTAAGHVQRVLKGHTGAVSAVGFSKDGRTLVSAGHDGTLRLWSMDKEENPTVVDAKLGHQEIRALTVSPDGRFVAAGGDSGRINIWKWGAWDKPIAFAPLTDKVKIGALAFSPDGELLACGSREEKAKATQVCIYATADSTLKGSMPFQPFNGNERGAVWGLSFSHDGKQLAAVGGDAHGRVWEVTSGKLIQEIVWPGIEGEYQHHAGSVAWSPDDKSVAVAANWRVVVVDLPSAARRTFWIGLDMSNPRIPCVTFSPRGNMLAAGGHFGDVSVWDTTTWKRKYLERGHRQHVYSVASSPNGQELVSLGDEPALLRWQFDRPQKAVEHNLSFGELVVPHPYSVSYNPDGKTYIVPGHTQITVGSTVTAKETVIRTVPLFLQNPAVSPDGRTVAGAGHDGFVHLWDLALGREVYRFPTNGGAWPGSAFSSDGKFLTSCNAATKRLTIWNVATGAERCSWDVKSLAVTSAFHPQGKTLATGHEDGSILLWDAATGKKLQTLAGHAGPIRSLKFTPDGKTLVSSGNDGIIRLWNPEQPRAREIIALGPANRPLTFDLDPSGRYLFAAGHTPLIFILRLP